MIITTLPKDLSEGARRLYSLANLYGGNFRNEEGWERKFRIDGESVYPDPAFIPELVEARLATTRVETSEEGKEFLNIWINRVQTQYAHADDGEDSQDHGMYVEIHIPNEYGLSEALMLTMMGATVRYDVGSDSDYSVPKINIVVRHTEATDGYHDPAYVANVDIINPAFRKFSDTGEIVFVGTLGGAAYYQSDNPLIPADAMMCDGGQGCSRGHAHPITNFTPPEVEGQKKLAGALVKVTMIPRRMVDANGSIILLDESREV